MALGFFRRAALAAALSGVAFAPAAQAAVFTPSQFVVFGDSFLDAGSVNRFTGGAVAPAAAGFFQGRFSDGPNWIDYLGYDLYGTATPAFNSGVGPGVLPPPFQPGATNFAVGGARASGDDVQPGGTIPGLPTQLFFYQGYLLQTGESVDPGALYVINFGNNDVNYIQQLEVQPGLTDDERSALIEEVEDNYVGNMLAAALGLALNGANHILIAGVPNPTEQVGIDLQTRLLAELQVLNPQFQLLGADVQVFDYFGFFSSLVSDPEDFGLPADLIVEPGRFCLAEVAASPDIDCSRYLSFDGTHVTTGVQRAIASRVADQLNLGVVPEPATWALMILGFGAVGLSLRRQRALAA